uniref:Uncharacterized protein n=1 Tax=Lotharella globosa TaxID=91324 RepID=A0A7S3YGT2_9EUKA
MQKCSTQYPISSPYMIVFIAQEESKRTGEYEKGKKLVSRHPWWPFRVYLVGTDSQEEARVADTKERPNPDTQDGSIHFNGMSLLRGVRPVSSEMGSRPLVHKFLEGGTTSVEVLTHLTRISHPVWRLEDISLLCVSYLPSDPDRRVGTSDGKNLASEYSVGFSEVDCLCSKMGMSLMSCR